MMEVLIAVLAGQAATLALLVALHSRVGRIEGRGEGTRDRIDAVETRVTKLESRHAA